MTAPTKDRDADGHRPVGVMMLPSVLTVAALCAGLTGVRFAAEGKIDLSILLVVVAAVLDGLDGRVARLLGASTKIGAELDSLADAINFGVTPALILYFTCLDGSPAGWAVVLVYVVAMVLRLARFNTLAADPTAPAYTKDFFVGVPAPAGALLVLVPLAAQQEWGAGWWSNTAVVAVWTLFIGALTVSRIPTSSFKTMTVEPAKAAGVLVVVACLVALILTFPYVALIVVSLAYLLHIPFAWRSKRWVAARPSAWETKPAERRQMRREQRRPVRPRRR
ncbi:phosphatidylcholine/phosphatidylserine synthase, partial [Tsukamurella sp. 1534]|uniref:CDP-alcohol phosphatidyltransferase family protein n=1 Tax=Tsukamurella sp. 1534 TaxID=1151061 RepID=UPI001C4FAF61